MIHSWRQFIKFGIVGTSSAAINLCIYYFCIWLDLNYVLANVIGWICSVCNTFFWNSYIVFSPQKKWIISLFKTYITYAVSLLIMTMGLWILIEVVYVSKFIAPIIMMVVMMPINFLINKYWVFKYNKD